MGALRSVLCCALVGLSTGAGAEQLGGLYAPWFLPGGVPVTGSVLICATGTGRDAAPCGGGPLSPMYVMGMPFVRATQDPIRFEGIGTTAKTFPIMRPAGATSYRFVNPCDVDVRIRRVESLSETITTGQGTMFLARTSETLGTSDPRFVSLIAMKEPSAPCTPELGYGNGG